MYTYGVEIITKFLWESGFLKRDSPLCTYGSAGYHMQLSVKVPETLIDNIGQNSQCFASYIRKI